MPAEDQGNIESVENDRVPADWAQVLAAEFAQPYWSELLGYVAGERSWHEVYPPQEQVFAALHLTPYEKTRVVILGQDPYPNPHQAHGLCFSVPAGVRKPRSLQRIFKELEADLGITSPDHGNLEAWAERGVLLLNTKLTVRRGAAGSHPMWEQFTDAIIRAVSAKDDRVVFLLWGDHARSRKRLIDTTRHHLLESAHPAAWARTEIPFLGSKPFSKTNDLLPKAGKIDWTLPAEA